MAWSRLACLSRRGPLSEALLLGGKAPNGLSQARLLGDTGVFKIRSRAGRCQQERSKNLRIAGSYALTSSEAWKDLAIDLSVTLAHRNSSALGVAVCYDRWCDIARHIGIADCVMGEDRHALGAVAVTEHHPGHRMAPRSLFADRIDPDLAIALVRYFAEVLVRNLVRSRSDPAGVHCSAGTPDCKSPVAIHYPAIVFERFYCRIGTEVVRLVATVGHIDCLPSW